MSGELRNHDTRCCRILGCLQALQMEGERAQGGIFQQVGKPQFFFHAGTRLDFRDHLDAQQRVAAQGEEIVVGAYFFDTQRARPDGGYLVLKRIRHDPWNKKFRPTL